MEYFKICVFYLLCLLRKVCSERYSGLQPFSDDEDWDLDDLGFGSGDDEYYVDEIFPQRNATEITTQTTESEIIQTMAWEDQTGVIAGAVLGVVFGLIICVAVGFFIVQNRRRKQKEMQKRKVLRSSISSAGIYTDLATEEPVKIVRTSPPIHIYENDRLANLYEYDSA